MPIPLTNSAPTRVMRPHACVCTRQTQPCPLLLLTHVTGERPGMTHSIPSCVGILGLRKTQPLQRLAPLGVGTSPPILSNMSFWNDPSPPPSRARSSPPPALPPP